MARKSVRTFKIDPYWDVMDSSLSSNRVVLEMYQSFMAGYVRRINEATFNVDIGGVRIGSAKHTRLAQINLKSRIITFSRFAIENVPERGRRYLVIHELAHVKEPSHNKKFWGLVEQFEPHYRQIDRSLDLVFKRNVKQEGLSQANVSGSRKRGQFELPVNTQLMNYVMRNVNEPEKLEPDMSFEGSEAINEDNSACTEEAVCDRDSQFGAISGGW